MENNTYKEDKMKFITLTMSTKTKQLLDKISSDTELSRSLIVESLIEAHRDE